jgi:hypothetical protein
LERTGCYTNEETMD